MELHEIKVGMKVIDRTLNVTYTWIRSNNSICYFCGFGCRGFTLWEDLPIINTFGDVYRGKYCVDCAGIKDLEPVVQAVQ